MVQKMNTDDFNAMDKSGLVVVDFNATWCGPCRMLGPVLEELSQDYEGKVKFVAIDTDENPRLAESFSVISIPAVMFLKDGVKVDQSIGFVPKKQLAQKIEGILN